VYCFNSVVDILWALRVERRNDRRRQFQDLEIDLVAPNKEPELVQVKSPKGGPVHVWLRLPFQPHNVMRRINRHIGNRRALGAAFAFGVGASCEFASAFLDQYGSITEHESFLIDFTSVIAYLTSAAIAISGREDARNFKPWKQVWKDAARLEGLGDAFFAAAAVVDTVICILHLDEDLLWWAVISASLWQIDAFCYFRGDIVSMALYKANRPLDDAASISSSDNGTQSTTSTDMLNSLHSTYSNVLQKIDTQTYTQCRKDMYMTLDDSYL